MTDIDIDIDVEGSCLCQRVRFRVRGTADEFYTCYCSRCRKETGSAFAANLFVALGAVVWLSGTQCVHRFELPSAEHFCLDFCSVCGSTVPYLGRTGEFYIVPAGTLAGEPGVRPTQKICWEDRARWLTG